MADAVVELIGHHDRRSAEQRVEWICDLHLAPPDSGHHDVASDRGAEHWATIASLIETCKLIGVEPHAYLADVISRIVNGHFQSQIDDLLPWTYPPLPNLKAVA